MVSKRARANSTVGTRLSAIQETMAELEGRTRTPAPDTSEERLEVVERKLEMLGSAHYRADEDLLVRGSDYAYALLDPAYVGPGPARVSVLPSGTLSDGSYEWRGSYYPWGNRVVNMIRVDGRWFIDGHSQTAIDPLTGGGRGGIVKLNLLNGWTNYSEYTGSYQYVEAQAQLLPSGIVVLSGLPGNGTVTSETVIATLPPGYRPDSDMMFPTLSGNAWKSIKIKANGDILTQSGWISSFASLDGIAFPAAGVASWTEIGASGSGSSFANSWAMYPNPIWGTPAYWKDPYGLVWFRGIISGGSRAADNTPMISLPASHRSVLQQHYAATAEDGFGLVGAQATNGLNYKNAPSGSSWISLAGITIVTQDSYTSGSWFTRPLLSGWSNYDVAVFPAAAVTRRPDGLGLSRGLIRAGTVGGGEKAVGLPRNLMPAMGSITPRPAGAAAGRVDIYGHKTTGPTGSLSVNFGSNNWVSLDGMKWMVGEL